MSDEEKKAIEFIKSELQDEKIIRNDYQSLTGLYGNLEIETILNLIEKQSKEIEELKDESKECQIGFAQGCYEKDLDWKDKIKAKIEEVKDGTYDAKIVLQSLLEKE